MNSSGETFQTYDHNPLGTVPPSTSLYLARYSILRGLSTSISSDMVVTYER
jgi:hypothetical protein